MLVGVVIGVIVLAFVVRGRSIRHGGRLWECKCISRSRMMNCILNHAAYFRSCLARGQVTARVEY